MKAKYPKEKNITSSTGHKMNKLEQKLAKDKDVVKAFNVLQALWRAKGEKTMEMVVEVGGTEASGEETAMRLTVTVRGERLK